MKIYRTVAEYTDRGLHYKRQTIFIAVAKNKQQLKQDIKSLYYAQLPEGYDYMTSGTVKLLEATEISRNEFGTEPYVYDMDIAGNSSYTGKCQIDEIIDIMTDNDPCFIKVRKMFIQNSHNKMVLYHKGSVNEASLRAIGRCVNKGIDPYGH